MGSVAANFNFARRILRLGPGKFDRQKAVFEAGTPNFHALGKHERPVDRAGRDAAVQKVPRSGLVPTALNNELMALDGDFKVMTRKPGNGQNDPQGLAGSFGRGKTFDVVGRVA